MNESRNTHKNSILFPFFAGMLGGIISTFGILHFMPTFTPPLNIGTLDRGTLVKEWAIETAKLKLPKEDLSKKMEEFTESYFKALETLFENKRTLLVKADSIAYSNAIDYTDQVRTLLKKSLPELQKNQSSVQGKEILK